MFLELGRPRVFFFPSDTGLFGQGKQDHTKNARRKAPAHRHAAVPVLANADEEQYERLIPPRLVRHDLLHRDQIRVPVGDELPDRAVAVMITRWQCQEGTLPPPQRQRIVLPTFGAPPGRFSI